MRHLAEYLSVAFAIVVTLVVYGLFIFPEASLGVLGPLSANSTGDPGAFGLGLVFSFFMGFVALMITMFLAAAMRV